jgi:hypothetical protein
LFNRDQRLFLGGRQLQHGPERRRQCLTQWLNRGSLSRLGRHGHGGKIGHHQTEYKIHHADCLLETDTCPHNQLFFRAEYLFASFHGCHDKAMKTILKYS